MPFDIEAARKDGVSDSQIADYLAQKSGFDIGKARNDGVADSDIVGYLNNKIDAPQKPGIGEDLAKTVGSKLVEGAVATPMVLANTLNAAAAGPQMLYRGIRDTFAGAPTDNSPLYKPFYSSSDLVKAAGLNYDPQTIPGKIAAIPAEIAGSVFASKTLMSAPQKEIFKSETSGSTKAPTPAPVTTFERQSALSNAYATAKQNKDTFPDIGDKYTSIIERAKAKPLPSGKFTIEAQELNRNLDDFTGLSGKAIGIDAIDEIDKSLTQKVSAAFNQNNKSLATKLMEVQDDFRDALSGTKAGQTLDDARALAANNFRSNDIEEILLNAKNYDNSATYIKNQFRNIAQNTRRLNSYPKEAQLIIKKIAEGGIAGDLLGQLGSRLGAIIGGATGGVGGAAIGAATGLAGRGAKTALYAGRAEKALNANNAPIRGLVQKYNMQGPQFVQAPQPPKFGGYLPAPTIAVNPAGGAATLAQRDTLGSGYQMPNPTIEQFKAMNPEQQEALLRQMLRKRFETR
jgi:hypothetical protein